MDEKFFDPDKLVLEKNEIIFIIEVVQNRLRKGKSGIRQKIYLAGVAAFKQGILWTPDHILKFVWRDMVLLTNKMIEYNARKRLMGEMPKTAEMLDMLKKEIESGSFMKMPDEDSDNE